MWWILIFSTSVRNRLITNYNLMFSIQILSSQQYSDSSYLTYHNINQGMGNWNMKAIIKFILLQLSRIVSAAKGNIFFDKFGCEHSACIVNNRVSYFWWKIDIFDFVIKGRLQVKYKYAVMMQTQIQYGIKQSWIFISLCSFYEFSATLTTIRESDEKGQLRRIRRGTKWRELANRRLLKYMQN